MKKVLYVWKDKYPWDVRAEKVCKSLLNAECEVYMLARNKGESLQREVIDGLNIIRVGSGSSIKTLPVPFNPIWRIAIKRAIKDIQPDIIVVREIMLAEDTARLANQIPVIIDMAEHYPAAMQDWKKYNKTVFSRLLVHTLRMPHLVEKRAVKRCNGIIVVCDEQVIRLEENYSFPRQNTCVVHNTPILSQFAGAKPSDIKRPITLCHHGVLSAEKSIRNLLLGFEIASAKHNIRLLIAGDGESYNDYQSLIEGFKHRDKIDLIGRYEYTNLPQLLVNIDIGVIPYQVSDFNNYTIHNKVFDYFACGKPVLTSRVKPLERIMEETQAGLAMDFSTAETSAEAIETMLNSDFAQMGENSLSAANNKYHWEIDAEKLNKFIFSYL